MSPKAPTSYDVARLAGVSQSAVSRAFSPTASIAASTRARVLAAAAELGYQPNAIARSMSSARNEPQQVSGMVGLIVTRIQDPYFAHTVAGLSRAIQARGRQILLFTVDSLAEVDAALSTLMRYKIDGALIISAMLSVRMAETCRSAGIPLVLYNRNAGPLDPAGYDAEIVKARSAGEPIFDIVQETPWARQTDAETAYRAIFAGIEPGLTFLSMHFNQPGDFETINPEWAHIRTEEYALFRTSKIKDWVKQFGIDVIGMRPLRDEMRAKPN